MKRMLLIAVAGMLLSCACTRAATADKEKEGTIAGFAIKRADSGWLGLELKDSLFRMTFYNDKKKPVPADRPSAVVWWSVHYQPNPERTELTPADDPAVLASAYIVKDPHVFKLHITLIKPGTTDVESYVVDYSG
ncbi:MAG TPA: hypothetical protein VIJ19_08515 [Opitutaceae bacterium]